MIKIDILTLSSLLFNIIVGLAHFYRAWETKNKAHWALFFVHLALVIVSVLIILFNVSLLFVGPASGVICALVVLRLLLKWLKSTQAIYSQRQYKIYRGIIYLLYVIYPICGIIWFVSNMLPTMNMPMLEESFELYFVAVCIFGSGQAIQSAFGFWLISGLSCMSGGNIQLKRRQIARLTVLSILLILPNMSNFDQLYISPIIWLIWSCIALWPRSLTGMNIPLVFDTSVAGGSSRFECDDSV